MTTTSDIRTCRTCKWFKPDGTYNSKIVRIQNGFCKHPNYQVVDRVTGLTEYPTATSIRRQTNAGDPRICGLDGVHWENEAAYRLFIRELKQDIIRDALPNIAIIIMATFVGGIINDVIQQQFE